MILHDQLQEPFEKLPIRFKIPLRCDYCERVFFRIKKNISRFNKQINKDSCGDKSCSNKKRAEVFEKTYGYANLFDSPSFQAKKKEKVKNNYGTDEYFQSEDFIEKRKNTLIEKYGVDSPLKNEEIKEKQRQTCLEAYGAKNFAQTPEFLEQYRQTSLENYGIECPTQSPEVIEKRKTTSLERYGKEHYIQTKEYWEDREKTCLQKYGLASSSSSPECREKYQKTCMERYGVPTPIVLEKNRVFGKTQSEIKEWLNTFGFSFSENYNLCAGKEIDLYDAKAGFSIEYCGLYWHNELSPNPRNRTYHYEKYVKCKEAGVHLYTIFEDEWLLKNEQCKGILLSALGCYETRIQARKCKIEEVSKKDLVKFYNDNHIMGSNRLGMVFFALKFNNEIVGAMSLGRHHRGGNQIVLDRLCFKSGTQIIGGASRLFSMASNWARNNNYNSIISWSDNRWSSGKIYNTLGFTLDEEMPPDYSYVDTKKPNKRISKQSQQKKKTGCPPELTEKEWSAQRGLARIWDCGKKRWIFSL